MGKVTYIPQLGIKGDLEFLVVNERGEATMIVDTIPDPPEGHGYMMDGKLIDKGDYLALLKAHIVKADGINPGKILSPTGNILPNRPIDA